MKLSHRFSPALIVLLACTLLITGTVACSQTVYQEIVTYVNEFLPIAEAVANLVIATETPAVASQAQSVETQVNNDLQLIETTASTITAANYSSQRAQIVSLAAYAKGQLNSYLTAVHISDPATVAKVTAYVDLGNAVIDEIVNALPAQQPSAKQMSAFKVNVGNIRVNYKRQFNRITAEKSGDAKVDAVLAKTPRFFVLGWHNFYPTFR
jgi:hypothetical protein